MSVTCVIGGRTVEMTDEEAMTLYAQLAQRFGSDARMGNAAARAWVDEMWRRKGERIDAETRASLERSARKGAKRK